MAFRKLTLEKALQLESLNLIRIYTPGTVTYGVHENESLWVNNFKELSYKYKKISVGSLMDFIGAEYIIDVLVEHDIESNRYSWVYLYAQDMSSIQDRINRETRANYVYILTNKSYPDLVKIGKAVNPHQRVEQINGAGVKSEWELKYCQPVSNDYKVENMMHKHFEHLRVASDEGHSREFFKVPLHQAITVLQFIAKDFYAGDGTYY